MNNTKRKVTRRQTRTRKGVDERSTTRGNALVFAHADGDGHLAAEQSRRNLAAAGYSISSVVVDPEKTRNWRFWTEYFQEADFGDAEDIFLVDLMLGGKDPLESYEALVSRVQREPQRQFHFIDHHVVANLPQQPPNLELTFTDSVFECCFGEPSELMLIASICDRDEAPVAGRLTERHRRIARGVCRAVTERNVLAGAPLLYLLRHSHWDVLELLADEPADFHRTFYGNRTAKQPLSPLLQLAYAVREADNFS